MEDRYPYIRFVVDAAQVIAAVVGLIVLLAGTLSSCQQGGWTGLIDLVIAVAAAAVAYVAVMVQIEALRVFLDIESGVRALRRDPPADAAGTPKAGA